MATVGARNKSFLLLLAMLISLLTSSSHAYSLATSTNHNSSETDRQALLCLRSHFSDPAGALNSWRSTSFSFCDWHGVSCNTKQMPRVVALDLASLNISGQISPCIGDLCFLERIDMASNQINGHIPPEIGNFTGLRYLNLSMNSITGVIPDTISSCSHLEVIRIMNNSIEGDIPPSLSQLQLLQEITFSNNNLHGSIPSGIGLLPSLQYLFLPSNNLEGAIPETLGSSPLLSMVVLRNNSLTGGIPHLLANCSSLSYLDLMKNRLSGGIPSTLLNSSSLVSLDLSQNNFYGSIPPSSSASSQLQYIDFTSNNLSGDIPATLGNLSSLSMLLLAQNNLQGSIPVSLTKIPSLQALDLAYNNLSGTVPQKIYTITSLTYLGLGVNNLAGTIPTDIGYTLPNIETLVLEGNHFEGTLPVSLLHATNLQALELRDNAFTGVVPSYWSLPNLTELDLGANLLESVDWSTLSSKTSSTQLQTIYLDNNKLQGILPNSVANLSRSLEQLFLTENKFSGIIPSEIGNLGNLTVLQLEGNLFSGGIPNTLGNLKNLFVLSLSWNRLSGGIPPSIGNLQRLNSLYLSENNFSGLIPPSIGSCTSLVMLNLSHNSFQGNIPPELLSISSLSEGLDLSYNKLSGSLSSNLGALINLGTLNISNNQLSGEIPHALGECLHLESIRLEVNFLSGSIPSSFLSLRGITEMDVSQNNMTGEIPEFLETFSALQYLNLSFNNFEGDVPTGGVFCNSSKVFLQGNTKLCANQPILQLPICLPTSSKKTKIAHILLVAIPVTCVAVVLIVFISIILFKKRSHPKQQIDESCKEMNKFSYSDLAKATNEFSSVNQIGSGRFGTIYKCFIKFEAHPVAIKVFKLNQIGALKNFFAECDVLRNTRHRNLIRVISLCSGSDSAGNDFKALILEYMSNGNLETWLHSEVHKHGNTMPLNLGSRIMIAVDIAAAVDYLQNWCTPTLVHCDLKPSNILLDDDMVAHVSDFGLAKFTTGLNSSTNIVGPRGSVGYIAPEYGMGCEISTAGDVYSYGVILLQMLTGKRPTDEIFKYELNLHKFVGSALPLNISEILDTSLTQYYQVEEANHDSANENQAMLGVQSCIKQLAKLGLKCSVDSPKDRPAIQDVYSEIISIRDTFSALCS
ncbi:hypothetical protein ACP70R_008138 [Stipagrostis hirtigluma subsp. patula]